MKNRSNPLQVRIEAVSIPKRIKPETYLRALLRAVDTGESLPRGWEVNLHWRNPETRSGRTRYWQDDEFAGAVADSSAGFNTLLRRMLVRKLYKARLG